MIGNWLDHVVDDSIENLILFPAQGDFHISTLYFQLVHINTPLKSGFSISRFQMNQMTELDRAPNRIRTSLQISVFKGKTANQGRLDFTAHFDPFLLQPDLSFPSSS